MQSGVLGKRHGVDVVPLAGENSAYVFVTRPPAVYIVDKFTEQLIALCDGEELESALSIVQDATQLDTPAVKVIFDDLLRKHILGLEETSVT